MEDVSNRVISKYAKGQVWRYFNPDVRKGDDKLQKDSVTPRPVLIIQNHIPDMVSHLTCVALTRSARRKSIKSPKLYHSDSNENRTVILPFSINTLAVGRLTEYVGTLPNSVMDEVDQAIQFHLGFTKDVPEYLQGDITTFLTKLVFDELNEQQNHHHIQEEVVENDDSEETEEESNQEPETVVEEVSVEEPERGFSQLSELDRMEALTKFLKGDDSEQKQMYLKKCNLDLLYNLLSGKERACVISKNDKTNLSEFNISLRFLRSLRTMILENWDSINLNDKGLVKLYHLSEDEKYILMKRFKSTNELNYLTQLEKKIFINSDTDWWVNEQGFTKNIIETYKTRIKNEI